MTISTRTFEGVPHRCPICSHESEMEVSDPAGDSCCPACGCLMWAQEHRIRTSRPVCPSYQGTGQSERTIRAAVVWYKKLIARYAPSIFSYVFLQVSKKARRKRVKVLSQE